jgi:hypothetical protein
MYTVEGLSIAEIARRLNREGIPPRRAAPIAGGNWAAPYATIIASDGYVFHSGNPHRLWFGFF